MSDNTNTTPVAATAVEVENPTKKYCFTRKQIIIAATATVTTVASVGVLVYLRAHGTDPVEVLEVAAHAASEAVEDVVKND